MITKITLKNFRAISEATIDFLPMDTSKSSVQGKFYHNNHMNTVAIIGLNATGKTTFFEGIKSCLSLIESRNTNLEDISAYQGRENKSTCFSFSYISKDEPSSVYEYSIEFNKEKIIKESLISKPYTTTRSDIQHRDQQSLFNTETTLFSEEELKNDINELYRLYTIEGYDSNSKTFRAEMTPRTSLFHYVATLDIPISKKIIGIREYISSKSTSIILSLDDFNDTDSLQNLLSNPDEKERSWYFASLTKLAQLSDPSIEQIIPLSNKSITFKHKNLDTYIPFVQEASGTRRLLSLYSLLVDRVQKESIIFIDEIETRLHPLVVVQLIQGLFLSNKHNCQLVFITHDYGLLDLLKFPKSNVFIFQKDNLSTQSFLLPLKKFYKENDKSIKKYMSLLDEDSYKLSPDIFYWISPSNSQEKSNV